MLQSGGGGWGGGASVVLGLKGSHKEKEPNEKNKVDHARGSNICLGPLLIHTVVMNVI